MADQVNIHSTGLVIGGKGLLLRGPSGAGKSLLALELMDGAELRGDTAMLVADDRIDLKAKSGNLHMHAPPSIAGLIELRGRGIVTRPHAESARVHLVVDIVPELVRLVEEDELVTEAEGVTLPRCPVPRRDVIGSAHQQLLVREALRQLAPARHGRGQKTA